MMASFPAKMGHQQSSDQLQRPLLAMATQGCSGENHDQKAPETLNESRASAIKRLIPQLLLLVIPACFIVLGVCIAMINGKAESKAGEAIMQATAVSATLWPIAFAAVVGPMVKAIALTIAEKGTRLGTLEVIFASQTLVSTLRGCLSFRIFSLWTLAIAAIWTLSPAGGQGASRAVGLQNNRTWSDISIQSFPINNLSYSGRSFEGLSAMESLFNQWSGLIGAAFLAPDVELMHSNRSTSGFQQAVQRAGGDTLAISSARSDLWGNVRVPMLHLLPGYHKSRPYEWVNVSLDTIPPYESLIGLPIRGMTQTIEGNGTTTISSYYHHLSCAPWVIATEWLLQNPNGLQSIPVTNGTMNFTSYGTWLPGFPNTFMDILKDTRRLKPSASEPLKEPNRKQVLMFGDKMPSKGNITLCEISTSYIDSVVNCTRLSDGGEIACAAQAVRHTKGLPVSGNLTAFDVGFTSQMLQDIPSILASLHPSRVAPTILEAFLKNPPSAFNTTYTGFRDWYYIDLPLEVFSARLSMVINTALRASLDMPSLVGIKSMVLENDPNWANTTGVWEKFTADKYVVKKLWFTLYMASTIVMTLCAVVNIVLRGMTRAPDFLGSISALTRDSPFVDAPSSGSAMDGTQRTRLLKDKWVRIQDVKPDEDVGRIAFSDSKGSGRLRMDRKYV